MSKLIIARHHESEWNKIGVWTGLRDIHMTPYGFQKAGEMGLLIKGVKVDYAFASMLVRTIETLSCMLNTMEQYKVPSEYAYALNERDYGDLTAKSKWEIKKEVGDEMFKNIRRDWDCPVPNGETLKMVYARSVPYFQSKILPMLGAGKNVLICSHGNTIRTLVKFIENIPDDKIKELEIAFGSITIYELDSAGKMISKETLQVESEVHA
jgi:2,3-bisphosphoglycerate-dependent phosphoglycerate mutase